MDPWFKVRDTIPVKTASGFHVGNKVGDKLFCSINNIVYGADILMPGPLADTDTWASGKKEIFVGSNPFLCSILVILIISATHQFLSIM